MSSILFTKQKTLMRKSISVLLLLLISNFLGAQKVVTGSEQLKWYLPLIKDKRIALVVNQSSMAGNIHLVDTLQKLKIDIRKIFAPEHGFRGNAEAGADIKGGIDKKTGLKVISLYGKYYKPSKADLADVDLVIFDIQDVGARFFTYISTLHYVMQACAQENKTLMILDRPNPNGYYVDGPVLDTAFRSFVGMHPVPIVHGMTIAEYAQMINGEHWLGDTLYCKLIIIKMSGWDHNTIYNLPVKPSPNLPTMQSVYLYPSLCLFEGTDVSVGRGTDKPFQLIGKPGFTEGRITFTPKAIPGVADNPMYKNQECRGFDLTSFCDTYIMSSKKIYLYWLQGFYEKSTNKDKFFTPYFDKLAGTDSLRKQIIAGKSVEDITKSWEDGIAKFKLIRKKYLLYADFE
jgi:uncharacterized protein YbbC (DUF1343 family)